MADGAGLGWGEDGLVFWSLVIQGGQGMGLSNISNPEGGRRGSVARQLVDMGPGHFMPTAASSWGLLLAKRKGGILGSGRVRDFPPILYYSTTSCASPTLEIRDNCSWVYLTLDPGSLSALDGRIPGILPLLSVFSFLRFRS